MLQLALMSVVVVVDLVVDAQMMGSRSPDDCIPYTSQPHYETQPLPLPKPIFVCLDTRYFTLMSPQCESNLMQYYKSPMASYPPIIVSTEAPQTNVPFSSPGGYSTSRPGMEVVYRRGRRNNVIQNMGNSITKTDQWNIPGGGRSEIQPQAVRNNGLIDGDVDGGQPSDLATLTYLLDGFAGIGGLNKHGTGVGGGGLGNQVSSAVIGASATNGGVANGISIGDGEGAAGNAVAVSEGHGSQASGIGIGGHGDGSVGTGVGVTKGVGGAATGVGIGNGDDGLGTGVGVSNGPGGSATGVGIGATGLGVAIGSKRMLGARGNGLIDN